MCMNHECKEMRGCVLMDEILGVHNQQLNDEFCVVQEDAEVDMNFVETGFFNVFPPWSTYRFATIYSNIHSSTAV